MIFVYILAGVFLLGALLYLGALRSLGMMAFCRILLHGLPSILLPMGILVVLGLLVFGWLRGGGS